MAELSKSSTSLPFVSIIMAVRNEAEHLEDCLRSVASLDYPPDQLEMILVDGNSTDATGEILTQWKANDKRISVLSNPKGSASAGMNLGVAAAKHDLVLWISGHSVLQPSHLRECYNTLTETGAAAVGGILTTKGTTTIGRINAAVLSHPFGVGGGKHRIGGASGWVPVVTMALYRKSSIEAVGGFDESLPRSQDNDLHDRMNKQGMRSYVNTEIRCTYLCRNTYSGLLKQAWKNGFWNIALTRQGHGGFSPRHYVPLMFVLGQVLMFIGGFFYRPLWWVVVGCLGFYALAAIAASIHAGIKSRLSWQIPLLPLWFASLHYTYGLASLKALFSRK